MTSFYVYAYIDPRDDTPFYIGKGKGNRIFRHLSPGMMQEGLRKGWFFYRKLKKLLVAGVTPDIHFVCEHLTEHQALYLESFFIKALGRRDLSTGCLCNLTDGGEGCSHAGCKHSDETKKIIADKLREIRTGWTLSEVTKQKIGDTHRGREHTDETKARMAAGQKKRFARQEERDKVAKSHIGKRHSEATRQRMSEAKKGKRHSEATCQRMSEANKGRTNSVKSRTRQSFTKWKKHWLKSGGTTSLESYEVQICRIP